ncbi:MAG: hypothetical protein JXR46_05425 [Calditrichaceae bacterium]|nr:hypothetical protein [Calditrichaceae bacterium]MBN2708466.1 hypothetical protein [Calditrichaceae bacterium]RQV93079.1 MAG: hypothetical protein EH224_13520 [Calditrichota bacterium]
MNIAKIMKTLIITLLIFPFIMSAQHIPSKERGDAKYRRKAQMEGNQIRASIFNHGQTGRYGGEYPITEQTPYEWPKNTGKVYLALTGIFVGGEVKDNDNAIRKIVDVCNYRNSPEGDSWNFEPIPGYFNENIESIANSMDPSTWPPYWPDKMDADVDPGWPGSWNGYFGRDKFNADQEIYYKASDDKYNHPNNSNYYPDTTDLSRRGLGIVLDVRVMAWSQVLVEDVVYILHKIKNDGTKNIEKVGVTIWHADFVGGDGDSQDDISEFDLLEDIAWSRDRDHKAPTFGSDPVGIVGVAFLETPGNAVDRIDNDGDGESGPVVTQALILEEIPDNLIDDNQNGLIDENETHIPFQDQVGVGYKDMIDNDNDGEEGGPIILPKMVADASSDSWFRWPPNPENDELQNGKVHILMLGNDDLGFAFADYIDNDDDGEEDSPVITQTIIDQVATDLYKRYAVPGSKVILYDVDQSDLGKKYADGIDNDNNGAIDEYIDEGIDEMIDEARDDGIDNDGDWDPFRDDVGLDGLADTGDEGENDGMPTPGRNGFPGEPSIDVTDVAETDQIGITNAQYIAAGGLNINNEISMYNNFMVPGQFYDPQLVVAGEYDLFISTGLFPLRAGQTEPFSIAVILGNGPASDPDGLIRKQNVLTKRTRAQETYNNDYQFANAPITPNLTAIPGDNKVTLYWNDVAENSFDSYINNIGGQGYDFEGYKLYRASDPAFEDATNITNGYGSLIFKTPIVQFDLVDGYFGFDSVGLDGIHYNLGNNSGLKHTYIDTDVKNGFTYYYALVSYDFGFPVGNIIPTECPIRISVQSDGSVKLGPNVVQVIPEAPAAGYEEASLGNVELLEGTTTGIVSYEIIDPNRIKDGHVYYISFEDTLRPGGVGQNDTLTTLNFTLFDSTANSILIDRNPNVFDPEYEQPMVDGFRLSFKNEKLVGLNASKSGWNNTEIPKFAFQKFVYTGGIKGEERPNDYEIIFGDVGIDTSSAVTLGGREFPAIPVNFKVRNLSEDRYIDFAFFEVDTDYGTPGMLSARGAFKDRIVFLEPNISGTLVYTWWFFLSVEPDTASGYRIPDNGDQANIILSKPFLSSDMFRFIAKSAKINQSLAAQDMNKIKVVPNPYLAAAFWEPQNQYNSGRGERSIHFTHLPQKCTIRIYTVNGELVDTIEHDSKLNGGSTAYWDLLTKDNLSISYGIYIFHVDAPGIGEKIGKFAVIK